MEETIFDLIKNCKKVSNEPSGHSSQVNLSSIKKKFKVNCGKRTHQKRSSATKTTQILLFTTVFFNLGSAEPRGSAKIVQGSAKYLKKIIHYSTTDILGKN
jgi:hypothetical protein